MNKETKKKKKSHSGGEAKHEKLISNELASVKLPPQEELRALDGPFVSSFLLSKQDLFSQLILGSTLLL